MSVALVDVPPERLDEVLTGVPASAGLPSTGDSLLAEYEELKLIVKQYGGGFLGLGRSIPGIQVRICRQRIELIWRFLAAVRLGYEPYFPSNNWFVGWLDRPRDKRSMGWLNNVTLTFNAPIPAATLIKFQRAKSTGLFSEFLVAALDQDLFIEETSSVFSEPVLIGYVQGRDPVRFGASHEEIKRVSRQQPGLRVQNGIGFLIDMWDLTKDLKAGGII